MPDKKAQSTKEEQIIDDLIFIYAKEWGYSNKERAKALRHALDFLNIDIKNKAKVNQFRTEIDKTHKNQEYRLEFYYIAEIFKNWKKKVKNGRV